MQDVLRPPHGLTAAFSFGIKGRDSWGVAVSHELGLPVHEFDCYTTTAPKPVAGTNLQFTPTCIGPADETRSGRLYATVESAIAARAPVNSAQPDRGAEPATKPSLWGEFSPRLSRAHHGKIIIVSTNYHKQSGHKDPFFLATFAASTACCCGTAAGTRTG